MQLIPYICILRIIDMVLKGSKPGVTKEGKDYCEYHFKNGSIIDNIAAKESSRGKRRHAGLLEECVGIDGDMLNSVILPIMQIDRRTACGLPDPDEPLNKS